MHVTASPGRSDGSADAAAGPSSSPPRSERDTRGSPSSGHRKATQSTLSNPERTVCKNKQIVDPYYSYVS